MNARPPIAVVRERVVVAAWVPLLFLTTSSCVTTNDDVPPPPATDTPLVHVKEKDAHAPPPFSARALRDGTVEGQRKVFRIERHGVAAMHHSMSFSDVDETSALLHIEDVALNDAPMEHRNARVTFAELESHAQYPASSTTMERVTVDVPAGVFAGVRYTVTSVADGVPTVTVATFADVLPGPPVMFEVRAHDVVKTRMMLIDVFEPVGATGAESTKATTTASEAATKLRTIFEGQFAMNKAPVVEEERWRVSDAGAFMGRGRHTVDGKVVFVDYMRVDTDETSTTLTAFPNGASPTVFTLTKLSDTAVTFENAAHDFPDTIVYERTPTGMKTTVSGKGKDGVRTSTVTELVRMHAPPTSSSTP